MTINVTKLTGVDLLHKANAFTTGKESRQTLKSAYGCGHTTIRTQLFWVECRGIPQFVAYHLRTHFSLYPMAPQEYGWMRSKRTDKGGADFRAECAELAALAQSEDATDRYRVSKAIETLPERYDRHAPTDFAFMVSAEGLMTMARKRLCVGAVSPETREVVESICGAVQEADPDLYPHLVRPCVADGVCREPKGCGFVRTDFYRKLRTEYKRMFID